MWYLVGLGNPGDRYRLTRHNLGFLVLERFASQKRIPWKKEKRFAMIGRGRVADQEIVLVKPLTFMNNSGQVVAPMVRESGITMSSLLVIHDDLDLPFGRIKIKRGGGAGGHKGVASVQEELNEAGFLRLKMGIGRPSEDEAPETYVLTSFPEGANKRLESLLDEGAEALSDIVSLGEERAMNRFNKRDGSSRMDEEERGGEDGT